MAINDKVIVQNDDGSCTVQALKGYPTVTGDSVTAVTDPVTGVVEYQIIDKTVTYTFAPQPVVAGNLPIVITGTEQPSGTVVSTETLTVSGASLTDLAINQTTGLLTATVTDVNGVGIPVTVDLSFMINPSFVDASPTDSVSLDYDVATDTFTVSGSTFAQATDPTSGTVTTTITAPDGTETAITVPGPDDECAEFATPATNPCNVNILGCEGGNKVSVPLADIKSKRVVCGLEAAITREGMSFTSSSAVNLSAGTYFTIHFEGTVTGAAGVVNGVTTAGNAQLHPSALGGSFAILRTTAGATHNMTWRVTRSPTLNIRGCPARMDRYLGGVSDLDTDAASMQGSCIQILDGNWGFEAFPVDSGYSETSPGVFCTDSTLPNGQPSLTAEADILPFAGQSASAIVTQAGSDWVSPHFICEYYRPVQVTLDCNGDFESAIDWLGKPIAESLITYTA